MQVAGERVAAKVVRERLAARAQRRKLRAALGDDLVLVLRYRVGHGRRLLIVSFDPQA